MLPNMNRRGVPLSLATLALVACGSGTHFTAAFITFPQSTIPGTSGVFIVVGSSSFAEGLWTQTPVSSGASPSLLIVDASGTFWYEPAVGSQCGAAYSGTISGMADAFSATVSGSTQCHEMATALAWTGAISDTTLTFSTPTGSSPSFSRITSVVRPSLASIAGNWVLISDGSVLTIRSDGSFYLEDSASGCVVSGQISIPTASVNVYDVSGTYGNCPAQGSVTGVLTYDMGAAALHGGVLGQGQLVSFDASAN